MVKSPTTDQIPKPKAISALLPHAITLGQSGDQEMVNAIIHLACNSESWRLIPGYINPYIGALLSETTPPSLDQAVTLLSPCLPRNLWDKCMVARWAAAVSAASYTMRVGWSVVCTLLWLASKETLRPHIPADIWAWLKKQQSLPPVCAGRVIGTNQDTVRHVRGLGDLDILKSYFLLVWSEWNAPNDSGFSEMELSIVEDLGGIGMHRHRRELIERLNHVLGELDRGLNHFKQHQYWISNHKFQRRKVRYGTLKRVLFRTHMEAMRNVAGRSQVDRL